MYQQKLSQSSYFNCEPTVHPEISVVIRGLKQFLCSLDKNRWSAVTLS